MQKKLRRLAREMTSLHGVLPLIVLLCWLLPTVVLGAFMGTRFFASLREKTQSALAASAEHACILTVNQLDSLVKMAKDVVYDGEIAKAAAAYEAGEMEQLEYQKLVRGYLNRKFSREALCEFALFFRLSQPDQLIYTSQAYSSAVRFAQRAQRGALQQLRELDTNSGFYRVGDTVYLLRNLYSTRLECYGVLVLGVNMEALLSPLYTKVGGMETQWAVCLDDFCTSAPFLGTRTLGFEECESSLCYTQRVEKDDYSLTLQSQTDKGEVYREMNSFRRLMIGLIVLIVPLCLLVMLFVHRRIVQPIALLEEASNRIQNGEWGVTVPLRRQDELGRLGRAFTAMSLRLKVLIDQSYKGEIALRDARIRALQSRINPHFINNALEMINWQSRMEGSEAVAEMVESLSILLNASMDRREEQLVPLREELRIAHAYFYFVTLRFGKRLRIKVDVEEAVRDVAVPRLCVQTLLENAVEHGIEPAGGGCISLHAYDGGGKLLLEVVNDGKRVTPEEAERIAQILYGTESPGGHIGIRNVHERLRLIFGEEAGLRIDTRPNGDTAAVITQPFTRPADAV